MRVGERVRHVLSEVLSRGDVHDDVLATHMVSVTEVRMSPDLNIATCFISPLGGRKQNGKGQADGKQICKALAKNAKFIRARATPHLSQMKYMPEFRFREDTSFDNYSKIDALLHSESVRRDLEGDD